MEAVQNERHSQLGERGIHRRNALECDDDMSDAGHRVCGLSVDSEVLVLPEDNWFILLRGWIEGLRVYLRVECGVDDPAHRTSWLWSVGHEGGRAKQQVATNPVGIKVAQLSSFITSLRTIMSPTGSGLRSKQEIVSLFDVLRSQLDKHQDTRERLFKVNTQLPLNQNLTHRRFSPSTSVFSPT